jgi:hypothetical protein
MKMSVRHSKLLVFRCDGAKDEACLRRKKLGEKVSTALKV